MCWITLGFTKPLNTITYDPPEHFPRTGPVSLGLDLRLSLGLGLSVGPGFSLSARPRLDLKLEIEAGA